MTPLQKQTAQAIVSVFETGSASGDYSCVSLIEGDSGHLSYGRAQISLTSGNLGLLVTEYCAAPGAVQAAALRPFIPRLQAHDIRLDDSQSLRSALVLAGADPVMRNLQDRSFDRLFWEPALRMAASAYLQLPLGVALVYDSCIQGGFASLRNSITARYGRPPAIREECWLEFYAKARHRWLSNSHAPLPSTVYRMDTFLDLIAKGNWQLNLPITVRGVTIEAEALDKAA